MHFTPYSTCEACSMHMVLSWMYVWIPIMFCGFSARMHLHMHFLAERVGVGIPHEGYECITRVVCIKI